MAKISNPRMFAGDQALATRNYVGKISGDLDTKITNVNDTLSENINNNFKAVKEWLTGETGVEPKNNGYAYLTKSGKIDPGLIPPISIVHTSTVSLDDILDIAGDDETQPSKGNDLMETWLSKTPEGEYQIGDMIIVTRGERSGYADALGPWIITNADGSYDGEEAIIKLAFPTSEIITVNGLDPDRTTGNVSIPLSSVILVESNLNEDGASDLAKAIYRLDYDKILEGRFAIKVGDDTTELNSEEYAKLSELESVSGNLTEEIEAISADVNANATAIEKINGDIGTLSGFVESLSGDIDTLSNDMKFVKDNGVGIQVEEIPVDSWTEIPVDQNEGSTTGVTSNIKYELEVGQGLYKFSKGLSVGETYLALCQNSCPIYPDVYVEDGQLNIVLVITTESKDDELKGLTLYTLKKIATMPNA